MLLPCEVAVKCLLPVVRASIANEMINKHNLKQTNAAKLLGVSQAAISLYGNRIRGKAMDLSEDKQIYSIITNTTEKLVKNSITSCNLMNEFCKVCRIVRKKGLLCDFHKALDPNIQVSECQLCYSPQEKSI
jgi:predicted transcriptional regulator